MSGTPARHRDRAEVARAQSSGSRAQPEPRASGPLERLPRHPLAIERVGHDVRRRRPSSRRPASPARPAPPARSTCPTGDAWCARRPTASRVPSSSTSARSAARWASVSRCHDSSNIVCCSSSSRVSVRCRSSSPAPRRAAVVHVVPGLVRQPLHVVGHVAGQIDDGGAEAVLGPDAAGLEAPLEHSRRTPSGSIFSQPHHRTGLVERPLRADHALHQRRLGPGEHVAHLRAGPARRRAATCSTRAAVERLDRLELVERDGQPLLAGGRDPCRQREHLGGQPGRVAGRAHGGEGRALKPASPVGVGVEAHFRAARAAAGRRSSGAGGSTGVSAATSARAYDSRKPT